MDDDKDLVYLGAGPLAAILLGIVLIPLRGYTSASNFTFLFLALTILVGEFGGRGAAVATAIAAALSLDFFLTEPYLRLSIASKHDVIACIGLAGCGILAASLAARRRNRE
jgi:K+-sensing histidine kinase KdpD